MRYLKEYILETDVQTALDNGELGKPYVAYIESEDKIDWDTKTVTPDYSEQYLTFKITSAGTINVSTGTTYSIDGGEWENTGTTLTVNGGESIRFKGNETNNNTFNGSTAGFEVEGNIMSLIYGDNFIGQTSIQNHSIFMSLFENCTGLTSAENLVLPATTLTETCYASMFLNCTGLVNAPSILPATTLANSCYQNMFNGCTNLVSAPELPATTLASMCYSSMFQGCTSLQNAPSILPATTLTEYCYYSMFMGCTGLTTAPELPVTTLTDYCYANMFYECSSLNYIKCLAKNISASDCTTSWLENVSSTGTFVKASGVEWPTGTSGIPEGWTVQEV